MKNNTVTIENARIIFRNFSGKGGQYNPEGNRNFSVVLTPEMAEELTEAGWNVKYLNPRDEGDEEIPYLKVSVSYKGRPPRIVLISSLGKKEITEETIDILDWAEITNVDLILNPYNWEVNKKKGIKAYLRSLYVTIYEDELELKYKNYETTAHSNLIDENE